MHIRISLDTKFQPKLINLIFWTKYVKKGYFQSKTEKPHLCVRPRLLLTQRYFNVSSFSSRRDKHLKLPFSLSMIVIFTRKSRSLKSKDKLHMIHYINKDQISISLRTFIFQEQYLISK